MCIDERFETQMELRQRPVKDTINPAVSPKESSAKDGSKSLLKGGKFSNHWYSLGRLLVLGFLVLYVIIPVLIHYSATVQRNLIFLSLVRWPLFTDLNKPESVGLPNTRNFYITTDENIKLGAWHILPSAVEVNEISDSEETFYENTLKDSNFPVILYLHGNSGTRGGPHRVELYQVLRRLNYHIVTFDYRGYADSSTEAPTENGVVKDSKFVYKWLQKRVGNSSIIIWGHSLGSGVATKLLKELSTDEETASGLILEAPFNNLRDELRHHPLTVIYRYMPYFDEIFLDAMERNIAFVSDQNIVHVNVPILILHAEDDRIIPIQLGKMLYESALFNRQENDPVVSFHTFGAQHGYGHRFICKAPELPNIVSEFISKNCHNNKK